MTTTIKLVPEEIDTIFAHLDQGRLPGAAVGIAIDGVPVYRRGFGLASIELPVLLMPSTRMRVGSVTKQFACFAYLLLCEEGKASLDDTLQRRLPEVHPIAHGVTVRQLMGHTSGLRDAMSIKLQLSGKAGRPVACEELLKHYGSISDVNSAPGQTFSYNNGAYVLLSMIIERIAEQPLEEFLKKRVLGPIGMHDSLLRRWDADFVPNCAATHTAAPGGGFRHRTYGADFAGGGALVSTVDDMLRWLSHMDRPVVGARATWAAMRAPHELSNGVSTGYGLGLNIGSYRGVRTLSHAGGWTGGNAQMLKVPGAGLDVIVIVNRDDVSAALLVERILDACVPFLEPPARRAAHAVIEGTFRSARTRRVVHLTGRTSVAWAGDATQFASIDGLDMAVEPTGSGSLRPSGQFANSRRIITLLGDPAHPSAIRLSDYGEEDELIAALLPRDVSLGTLVGRYRSESTGCETEIRDGLRGPEMETFTPYGSSVRALRCLADGIWDARADDDAAFVVLSFDDERRAFHLFSRSLRALVFAREA